jgi:hypothetical protein
MAWKRLLHPFPKQATETYCSGEQLDCFVDPCPCQSPTVSAFFAKPVVRRNGTDRQITTKNALVSADIETGPQITLRRRFSGPYSDIAELIARRYAGGPKGETPRNRKQATRPGLPRGPIWFANPAGQFGLNVWPDCGVVANWLPKFVKKQPEAMVLTRVRPECRL